MKSFPKSLENPLLKYFLCYKAWLNNSTKTLYIICRKCLHDRKTPKEFSERINLTPSPVPNKLQNLNR